MNPIIFDGERLDKKDVKMELAWGKNKMKEHYPNAKYISYYLEITPRRDIRLVIVGDDQGTEVTYTILLA